MEVKFIVKSLRTRTPFAVIFIIQIDRILAKDGIRAGVIMKFTLFSLGQPELFFFAFFLLGSSFLFLGCSLVKWKCHSSRIMQYKLLQLERSYSTDEGALWVENWELRTGNPLTIDKRQPTKEDILTCVCLKASGKTWNHKRSGWLTGWLDGWPKESFMSIIPVKWAANQSFGNFLSAFQIQKITIWNPIRWA